MILFELKKLLLCKLDDLSKQLILNHEKNKPIFKISTSKFLNALEKNPFNEQEVAEKIIKNGCKKNYNFVRYIPGYENQLKAIKQYWKELGNLGTKTHEEIEIGVICHKLLKDENFVLFSKEELMKYITPKIIFITSFFKNNDLWFTEFPIYSKEYDFIGIIDAVYKNINNNYDIADWKTMNDDFSSIYENYNNETFKPPFQNYFATKYNRYYLQLNIYRVFLEKICNFKVDSMVLVIFAKNDTRTIIVEHDKLIESIFFSSENFKRCVIENNLFEKNF